MPQEFEPAAAPVSDAFAAQQKVTPEEAAAALDALHARQEAPLDFDLDLSVGQVLDELDLPLSAADLWREVQALRARKAQAAVSPQAAVPVAQTTPPPRRPRRWRLAAGTLAAVLALSVPVARYALKMDAPDVSLSQTTNNVSNRAGSVNNVQNRSTQNTVTGNAPSTQNGPAQTGTSAPQNAAATGTQAAQTPPRPRFRLPEPGNIINADNQTRTLTPEDGQVVIGGNNDTITVQGHADLVIVNGNRAVVRLRGPVGQVILGGSGSTVTYSRAFPAPQVIDNGTGNTVRAEERGPKLDSLPPARL